MSVGEARRTHKTEDVCRREILASAAELFAENGYWMTDVQAIADHACAGKGTIYRLFPTKEALFLAAVDLVMVLLQEEIEEVTQDLEGDPLAQVVFSLRAYLAFFDRHPGYAELFIQERAVFPSQAKPIYFVYREANIEKWREIWKTLIEDGYVRSMPVDTLLNVLGDFVYGAIMSNRVDRRSPSLNEQADSILDILFHGILEPAGREKIRALDASPGGNKEK